jgi:hypothetical protein
VADKPSEQGVCGVAWSMVILSGVQLVCVDMHYLLLTSLSPFSLHEVTSFANPCLLDILTD